jgi:hypothetical protein
MQEVDRMKGHRVRRGDPDRRQHRQGQGRQVLGEAGWQEPSLHPNVYGRSALAAAGAEASNLVMSAFHPLQTSAARSSTVELPALNRCVRIPPADARAPDPEPGSTEAEPLQAQQPDEQADEEISDLPGAGAGDD